MITPTIAADMTRVVPQPPAAAERSRTPKQDFGRVLAGQRARPKSYDTEPTERVPRPTAADPAPADRSPEQADDETDVEPNDSTAGKDDTKPVKPSSKKPRVATTAEEEDAPADSATELTLTENGSGESTVALPMIELPSDAELTDDTGVVPDKKEPHEDASLTADAVNASQPATPVASVPMPAVDATPTAEASDTAARPPADQPVTSVPQAAAAAELDGQVADALPAEVAATKHKLKSAADITAEDTLTDTVVVPNASQLAEAAKAVTDTKAKDAEPVAAIQPTAVGDKPSIPAAPLIDSMAPAAPPQRPAAEENVDRIVTSVRGEIAKGGGTVQIRLDPPSLGQVNVQISVDDGVLSASLQTTNDEATRLLSHNLQQLKTTLEHAGVTVDRIQVKQAAPAEHSSGSQGGDANDRRQGDSSATQDQSARQEQQRRQMLQRMWARVAGDPLDLVA